LIENSIYNTKETNVQTDASEKTDEADKTTRFFAIKKIALFYFNYYEIARFGNYNWDAIDEIDIIDPVKDAYNYMDIMKLYYGEETNGD